VRRKQKPELESWLISRLVDPGDAGVIMSRIDTRVTQILGEGQSLKDRIIIGALCMEMFAKGALWGCVPPLQRNSCLNDILPNLK
jgi:hypothetical protein